MLLYPGLRTGGIITAATYLDTDWPSALNRPSYNSGTNTLSWVGPSGGGANNGTAVLQSRVLAGAVASIATSADSQIIAGQNVTSFIQVQHNNVTIRQCRGTTNGANNLMVFVSTDVTGLIIEDCLFDGQKASLGAICPLQGSLTGASQNIFRRNMITGFENGITLNNTLNNNFSITDNYITAFGNSNNGAPHGDFVEFYQCANVTFQHNQLDGANSATPGFTSMINIVNSGPANVSAVSITGNLFSNCQLLDDFAIVDGPDFGTATCAFSFTNNGFHGVPRTGYGHGTGGADYTVSPNSGNYVAASQTATSGTLISGAGTIGSGQIA